MGHRFVPHEKPESVNIEDIYEEVSESTRKLGWMEYIDNCDIHESKPKKKDYIVYKKNSPLPSHMRYEMDNIARSVSDSVFEKFQASKSKLPRALYKAEWSKLIHSGQGKWLICDKNLGVKNVSNDEYEFLQQRESKNYEYHTEYSVDDEQRILKHKRDELQLIKLQIRGSVAERALDTLENFVTEQRHRLRSCGLDTELRNLIDHCTSIEGCKLPRLKLLLKIHKKRKNGHYETRPIVPTCALPEYQLARFIGGLLARATTKTFPWVLECTDSFINWLTMRGRSSNVFTFDFSNLFGSEPVVETIKLLNRAVKEMNFMFDSSDDRAIWSDLMVEVFAPSFMTDIVGDTRIPTIVMLTAFLVKDTIAVVDLGRMGTKIVGSSKFLAMGSCPVAPLSNITLGYLEQKRFGRKACIEGMRRLIDDIVIDEDYIKAERLRSAYPQYLTLNDAGGEHFLDVYWVLDGKRFLYWLYTKPYPTIPLNYHSCHPSHVKLAAAENELHRMLKRTNIDSAKRDWAVYWLVRYRLACYPEDVLMKFLQEAAQGWIPQGRHKQHSEDRVIHHLERWRDVRTGTSGILSFIMAHEVRTTWKVGTAIKEMAFKSNASTEVCDFDYKNFLSSLEKIDSPIISLFSKESFTPDDAQPVQRHGRKALGTEKI